VTWDNRGWGAMSAQGVEHTAGADPLDVLVSAAIAAAEMATMFDAVPEAALAGTTTIKEAARSVRAEA